MQRRAKVYAPAPELHERSLLGEIHQIRYRLELIVPELEALSRYGPNSDRWRDTFIACGLALRAVAVSAAATPERPLRSAMCVGDLRVDPLTHRQWLAENEIVLSPLHHRVLATMASDPYRGFSKAELLQRVWAKSMINPRGTAVNHAICRIRKSLAAAGATPDAFLIVTRSGWVLAGDAPERDGL